MRTMSLVLIVLCGIGLGCPPFLCGTEPMPLLDVRVGDQQLSGRVVTHSDQFCWLLQRDGRLHQLPVDRVEAFKVLPGGFQSHSASEMKSRLQAELGKAFEVRVTHHYVVAAIRGRAEAHAAVFEQIYREFARSFRSRGIDLLEPEFPLIAVVYPNQTGFVDYLKSEKVMHRPGMVGCYLHSNNRVAAFEHESGHDVDATLIHEATHQVAFNTGLHSRIAVQPKWVVEGLALVYEADGIRSRQGTTASIERVNRQRHLWFQEYAASRRKPDALLALIQGDEPFDVATLDAYSEAWALTFFLLETRPGDYIKYLKKLALREVSMPSDSVSRRKEFTDCFGQDVGQLELAYLRFFKRINQR